MSKASLCFHDFRKLPWKKRSYFLIEIGRQLLNSKNEILSLAAQETALDHHRLTAEFDRTVREINRFAKVCANESERNSSPQTTSKSTRIELLPIGTIVVIGACNFPLAISVVGTDTISALMMGCPVVVKSHPFHPKTCQLLADLVRKAIRISDVPSGCFNLLHGGKKIAQYLVAHPLTHGVAFTGSLQGGKALHEIIRKRKSPIPLYAEMGSLNPVFALPDLLRTKYETFAKGFVDAVNLYAGQMCTKPGLLFLLQSSLSHQLITKIQKSVHQQEELQMLHSEIFCNYEKNCLNLKRKMTLLAESKPESPTPDCPGRIRIFQMDGADFLKDMELRAEAFGPCSIIVSVQDESQLIEITRTLSGSLTASVHHTRDDFKFLKELMPILTSKVGRLLHNGFPPGVIPGSATHHGGFWPATNDPRFTSIGEHGYKRFVRPLKKIISCS